MDILERREKGLILIHTLRNRFFNSLDDFIQNENKYLNILNAIGNYDDSLEMTLFIHYFLVLKTIHRLNHYKYQDLINKLFKMEQIGCLAITELSHHNNVKDIQTRIRRTDNEFVIHNNDMASQKYFVGNSDISSVCLLYGQYWSKEQNMGVQPFIVKIRDQNHDCIEGVFIQDYYIKNGYNGISTGIISFNNYVPKEQDILLLEDHK